MPKTETPRKSSSPKKEKTPITDALAAFRDFLDRYSASGEEGAPPTSLRTLPGGLGLGTLIMGEAPEEYRRWGKGDSPLTQRTEDEPLVVNTRPYPRGGIVTNQFQFKPNRILPTLDAAMVGADAAGLAALAVRGARGVGRAAAPVLNPEVNTSRREFLGNTGKIAAGAAAAATLPAALRVTEHIAPRGGEIAAARGAARAATRATVADYYAARRLAQERAERVAYEIDGETAHLNPSEVYEETLKQEMDKLYENPAFEQYREHMDMERAHNDAAKQNYNDFKKSGQTFDEWDDYREKDIDLRNEYASKNHDFKNKHGAALDLTEESWAKAADPEYKLVDPETHIRYVWAKVDEATGKMVQVDPRLEPDAFQAQMMPHSKEILHYGYSGRRAEVPASYYEKYLKERGHKLAKGGSVTMPNNYRAGGRVRII